MLSKAVLVKVQSAIEGSYRGQCDVVERLKVQGEDMSTGFEEVTTYEGVPCKLSFEATTAAQASEGVSALSQNIKVFVSPELTVKAGSKLIITQDDATTAYRSSGPPVRYPTHQELDLDLFQGWA